MESRFIEIALEVIYTMLGDRNLVSRYFVALKNLNRTIAQCLAREAVNSRTDQLVLPEDEC